MGIAARMHDPPAGTLLQPRIRTTGIAHEDAAIRRQVAVDHRILMRQRPVKHVVRRQAVQARVQPGVTGGRTRRAGASAAGRCPPPVENGFACRAAASSSSLRPSRKQHAERRVVAQQDRLLKQQTPHLLMQRPDRRHGVVDQVVHRRAAGEPAALGKPVLLAIRRHVEGELHRQDRRDHAEVVLAALDDRQRRGHRPHARLGLARHHVLRPLDDLHVHVRLFKPQPLGHLHADALQTLLLFLGKIDDPLAPFDVRREFFAAVLPLLAGPSAGPSRRRSNSRSVASSALAWAVMISCSSALGGSSARRQSSDAADRATRCDARCGVPKACRPDGCSRLPVPPPACATSRARR